MPNLVEDRTTQLRVALSDLETLTTTDQLMGVYNRHKFEDLPPVAWRSGLTMLSIGRNGVAAIG